MFLRDFEHSVAKQYSLNLLRNLDRDYNMYVCIYIYIYIYLFIFYVCIFSLFIICACVYPHINYI